MSNKTETVRVNRKTLERLKEAASFALGEEIKLLRRARQIATDKKEMKTWAMEQGSSAFKLKGETPEEVAAIQNRSAIRSAGVGALLAWLVTTDMVQNSKYIQEHWWLLPLAVLALGYWLRNRGYKDGPAILTFGGALLAQAYQKHRNEEEAKKKAATTPSGNGQVAGLDTGALVSGAYAWLQDPFGQWIKVTLPAALPHYAAGHVRALPAPSNTNTAGPSQEDYEAAQQLAAAAFAAV